MLRKTGRKGIYQPGYLKLIQSGELQRRATELEARLAHCDICPRRCGVNRLNGETGFCRTGSLAVVVSSCDHHGEEPPVSGQRGSGAIFFGNCNLKCVYCQNYQISQEITGRRDKEISAATLAHQMSALQEMGCHNINLVSPSHVVPQIFLALIKAVSLGLRIPLVYNTNAYDSLETLRALDGVVDVYLPDIKYASDMAAVRYSQGKNYVRHARQAIKEMYRQVGHLVTDGNGIALRGIIVRHLILPNGLAGSDESLEWLAREVSPALYLSVMAQYHPSHRAPRIPLLSRRISWPEYRRVNEIVEMLGFENGWVQDMESPDYYLPDFSSSGHPFQKR